MMIGMELVRVLCACCKLGPLAAGTFGMHCWLVAAAASVSAGACEPVRALLAAQQAPSSMWLSICTHALARTHTRAHSALSNDLAKSVSPQLEHTETKTKMGPASEATLCAIAAIPDS